MKPSQFGGYNAMARMQVLPLRAFQSATEHAPDADARDLVRSACSGDLKAFEELVLESQAAVTGVVSRIIERPEDVDDVVQDVYIQAFQHLRSFRGESRFSTWIHRIAVNTALKRLKQMRRKANISLDDPDTGLAETLESDPAEAPPDVLLKHEREHAVREAVSELSEKHRIVVTLRYFDDYSCEEIAAMLGCSVGTVWSRLHYACRQLRTRLGWVVE
ncbi:MAG TPA: sigma-70 family RNA polymerase sigma factor [Armatimonadota bacterium]|nr:sigma-70 family RNA polymerase sigma factor [Armatimonadota bacterium]